MAMDTIRKHFILHGSVQGVGLRYRAYYAARQLGVGGYVRNLDDGTVEMEAEGEREAISKLLEMIRGGHFIDIEWMEEKTIPVRGDRDFERD